MTEAPGEPPTMVIVCPCDEFTKDDELEPRLDTCLCGHPRGRHDGGDCTARVTLRPRRHTRP